LISNLIVVIDGICDQIVKYSGKIMIGHRAI